MKKIFLFLPMICLLCSGALAQEGIGSLISPGELASPHSKYDGITSCTECHALGGGIPDSKCLNCHDKLAEKIKNKKGPHATYTEACIKCHSDHKGRGYKMIALNKGGFDHDSTGYSLKDKHRIDCDKCHKKEGKYTGLSGDCLSCHKDKHKGQLDKDCEKCHSFTGWKDIEKFKHDISTKYHLTGKHIDVKCVKCHENDKFKIDKFEECITCHRDPHKEKPLCKDCHTTEGWKKVKTDHDKTRYPLTNKHNQVACEKCHKDSRLKGIPFAACNSSFCHRDPHKEQFKDKACESCHNTGGWKPSLFKHDSPEYKGYKLEDKHVETKCEKCHTEGRYKPLNYRSCDTADCHKDTHKGQFKGKNCESCHNMKGWKPSLFKHEAPEYKGYRLEGKHLETKCEKCHAEGRYRPLNYKTCDTSDCHKDIHKGQFAGKLCDSCHNMKGWKSLLFKHDSPEYKGYRLEGKHVETKCEKCHEAGKYKPISSKCIDCHEKDDVHKNELGKVCEKCHDPRDWKKPTMNHNTQTKFPLVGKHIETKCEKCHKGRKYKSKAEKCKDCHEDIHKGKFKEECSSCHTQYDWQPRRFDHKKEGGLELKGVHNDISCISCHKTKGVYTRVNRLCNQCHTDPHFNQFGSMACQDCHTENSWNPTRFNHSTSGYPLTGRHRTAECGDCHRNRVYRGTLIICAGCHRSPASHASRGFVQDCIACHNTSFTSWSFTHPAVASGCSTCHFNYSSPARPASHTANNYGTTCENCHTSTATWSAHRHAPVSSGCSTCHLSYSTPPRPASHTGNPTKYPLSCENCHNSTNTWTSHVHPTLAAGCSICHLPQRPASHITSGYGETCETCHKSNISWTFSHTSITSGCSTCHLSKAPAAHNTYSSRFGPTCENCHKYPAWPTTTFNHAFTPFPLNHRGTASCSRCHPAGNYGNKGGCIECHSATGAKVHEAGSNAGCLGCHSDGRVPAPKLRR